MSARRLEIECVSPVIREDSPDDEEITIANMSAIARMSASGIRPPVGFLTRPRIPPAA